MAPASVRRKALELRCGCDGCVITALIVPCETGVSACLPFGKHTVRQIPWERVECIGEDAILVRLPRCAGWVLSRPDASDVRMDEYRFGKKHPRADVPSGALLCEQALPYMRCVGLLMFCLLY